MLLNSGGTVTVGAIGGVTALGFLVMVEVPDFALLLAGIKIPSCLQEGIYHNELILTTL
jgi:hypothetical protein